MKFSSRIEPDLSPNPFSAAIEQARAIRKDLLDLTMANPTQAGFDYPSEEIARVMAEAADAVYRPDPKGLLAARKAVADYYRGYGLSVDPGQIILTAGTSEAYTFLFKLLCDPGDRILFPKPSYPLIELIADLEGVEACPYALTTRGWRWNTSSLLDCLDPKTKAVIAVSPNNPTGSMLTADELDALGAFAAEQRLALIVDEVFLDYPAPARKERVVSAAGNSASLTFTLGGLSKACGMPQMKLAWIAVSGPAAETQAAIERLEFIADAYLSVGTPVQEAAPGLLAIGQSVRDQIRTRIDRNDAALRATAAGAINIQARDGGWYAILGLPDGANDEEFAMHLLEQDGVLVQPGFLFDLDDPAVVVSLLTPEDDFRIGIQHIQDLVNNS